MATDKRLGAIFVSGFLLGAAAAVGAWKKRPAALPLPDNLRANIRAPQSIHTGEETRALHSRNMPEKPATSVPPPLGVPEEPTRTGPKLTQAVTSHRPVIFAGGFALMAAALAVATWMLLGPRSSPIERKVKAGAAPSLLAPASPQSAACLLQPAVVAAGPNDGRFPLQPEVSGLIAADIASFIVIGREAVAAGRPRDAEAAFLMSCRVADKLKGPDSAEFAEAKYELASHYASLARADGSAGKANGAELLRRAELLYSDSAMIYRRVHGDASEKSRNAAEELAAVRQSLASAQRLPTIAAAQIPAPASLVSPGAPQRLQVELAQSIPPAQQKRSAAMRFNLSFDCAKARSTTEKMICSDAELARLDRELGRIYARARNSTSDRAAFRRQKDREWQRREATCRDRECLLRWYAQRREQLMTVIARRGQRQPKAASLGNSSTEAEKFYGSY